MKPPRLLLDTNVVLDFLAAREPFNIAARSIVNSGANGDLKLYVAAASFGTIYYILRKNIPHVSCVQILDGFVNG